MSTATSSAHDWLRRVSDYHSGGISDAERAAAEAHLAACVQCQEALSMYRRFYSLARSPLRLGAPSPAFDGSTDTLQGHPPSALSRPLRPRPPRRDTLLGLAAALVAVLVVAGFLAVFASGRSHPSIAGTPTPHPTLTAAPNPTTTGGPTAEPTPTAVLPNPFVCANPVGSNMVYAYARGDGNTYEVVGCSQPKLLFRGNSFPLAWSPSHRYLMVSSIVPAPDVIHTRDEVIAVDAQTGAQLPTGYTEAGDFGDSPQIGDTLHIFLGWIDDQTFLGTITPVVQGQGGGESIGPSSLVRVELGTGKETPVTRITWWANAGSVPRIVASGRYLFYGGYQSKAEGQAYLHRIDLITGTDTRLVPLGIYGNGGCQVTPICGWTGPWDVSSDGSHILYHSPGPTSFPSEFHDPKDTPIIYAKPDGSAATRPFGSQLALSLTGPGFSPNGAYAVAAGSSYTGSDRFTPSQVKLVHLGDAPILINGDLDSGFGDSQGWRGDSKAILLGLQLYSLATGETTPLEENAYFYVWATS